MVSLVIALGLGFVADDDAVAQDIGADALDVLRRDVAAAVQERVGARGQREVNRGARRSAVTNQAFQIQIVRRRLARRPDDIDDVILHAIVDVDAVHDRARRDDLLRIDDRRHVQVRRRGRHQIENLRSSAFCG